VSVASELDAPKPEESEDVLRDETTPTGEVTDSDQADAEDSVIDEQVADNASSVEDMFVEANAELKSVDEVEAADTEPVQPTAPIIQPAKKSKDADAQAKEGDEDESEDSSEPKLEWYVVKVQVNREESVRKALERRVSMYGLDKYFGKLLVPTERVTEVRAGKKRTRKVRLLPGYLIVQMEINDETWFLIRETSGIGDFTGPDGKPTPMEPHEVQRLLAREQTEDKQEAKIKISFVMGDRVKIKDGTFANYEGEVHQIDDTSGVVVVMINIFGRSTPVTLEYWQIEAVA
jgi:transcription termination/antitermination protein NusG